MPKPPAYRQVINGYMTTVANRREDGHIAVVVTIYNGPEATGEPLVEWALPHIYRYSHEEAAQLVHRQSANKLQQV